MGQFKPMVKMETTEPTVILKLKKGGHVMSKAKAKEMDGHKPMCKADGGMMGALASAPALVGRPVSASPVATPMKPSMAMRRKAMMAKPKIKNAPVPVSGLKRVAPPAGGMPAGMPTSMPAMKKGGESKAVHAAEMKKMSSLEKELMSHEGKPASKAHKGLKTGGVAMGKAGYKTGGVVMGQGGYAKGGGVEGNVSGTPAGKTNTKTGSVRLGNAGGFKKGGKAKKFADGGDVYGTPSSMNPDDDLGYGKQNAMLPNPSTLNLGGMSAFGGFGNTDASAGRIPTDELRYGSGMKSMPPLNAFTQMNQSPRDMRQAQRQAQQQMRQATRGRPNQPIGQNVPRDIGFGNGPGRGVIQNAASVNPNQAMMKKGGKATKFAKGGTVQNDGHAVKMPQGNKKPSAPVSISRLSGTFKKGGKISKYAEGGDAQTEKNERAYKNYEAEEKKFNESLREDMSSALTYPFRKMKQMFTGTPAPKGSVTKTKESVTVSKKRGGKC